MKARNSFRRNYSIIKQLLGNRGCGGRREGPTSCMCVDLTLPSAVSVDRSDPNCHQEHQKVAPKHKLAMPIKICPAQSTPHFQSCMNNGGLVQWWKLKKKMILAQPELKVFHFPPVSPFPSSLCKSDQFQRKNNAALKGGVSHRKPERVEVPTRYPSLMLCELLLYLFCLNGIRYYTFTPQKNLLCGSQGQEICLLNTFLEFLPKGNVRRSEA